MEKLKPITTFKKFFTFIKTKKKINMIIIILNNVRLLSIVLSEHRNIRFFLNAFKKDNCCIINIASKNNFSKALH